MKVLVVEDDMELRSVLSRGLREEGFDVHTVGTGGEVLPRVATDPPAVLIEAKAFILPPLICCCS